MLGFDLRMWVAIFTPGPKGKTGVGFGLPRPAKYFSRAAVPLNPIVLGIITCNYSGKLESDGKKAECIYFNRKDKR